MTQNKKPKWDGRSRVSTNIYRKRFNEIFKKLPYNVALKPL